MHLKKYLENQKEEMLKYKWCKGVQIGKDPGESACKEWVEKYAKKYREEYEEIYNKVIDVVTESIKDDISHAVTGCNCSDSSLVRKITKRVIEEFITQWVSEKIKNPQNVHLDEI
jgi:hypothetical protein